MPLSDIRGQARALKGLSTLLSTRRLPPALLFIGPSGVGKSSAALEFAKALNCAEDALDACGLCASCASADKGTDPDLVRVDAAYQAGLLGEEEAKQRSIRVDTVRHLISGLELRSLDGRWKTAIVEDAHLLVTAAANAMLKALEEPPARTLWILVTHRPELLLDTIRSRCQVVRFSPLSPGLLASLLAERGVPGKEAHGLARTSEGSLGRALALRAAAEAEGRIPDPAEWLTDPLAPIRLAEGLPKELHLSRPAVEEHLRRMAWHLRSTHGTDGYASASVRALLREFAGLRKALQSNADPRLVLQLAALGLERAVAKGRPS